MLNKYLTVTALEKFTVRFSPYFFFVAIIAIVVGTLWGLFFSPADYQQGDSVRIMYVHVPSAWMAMMVYGIMASFSFGYLVWRNPVCFVIAKAAAPIGAMFCFLCLVTGSLWGYPMWGTWWVWDARLTSMLILLFLYFGYLALDKAYDTEEREAKVSSVLALIGAINLPIIKYSVEWWNTLHQPASVMRIGGPTIDSAMLTPLIVMFIAWFSVFMMLLSVRIRIMLLEKKLARYS